MERQLNRMKIFAPFFPCQRNCKRSNDFVSTLLIPVDAALSYQQEEEEARRRRKKK